MKRLLFPAFVSITLAVGALAVSACDPDLTPKAVAGEGGKEEPGTTDSGPKPIDDSGMKSETGPDEGGADAAVTEHKIDGTNDFAAGEKLATTSSAAPAYSAYISWDDKKIYFGMEGDAVAAADNRWVLIYVDGNPGNAGTSTGLPYGCGAPPTCTVQQATLPFNAGFHIRWKSTNSYTNLQQWNATSGMWDDKGAISTFARNGKFMELSVARVALGSPAKLKVHVNMLIEKTGEEWTFAGVPSASFTDGVGPSPFQRYFEFDLADKAKAPNTYAPKP